MEGSVLRRSQNSMACRRREESVLPAEESYISMIARSKSSMGKTGCLFFGLGVEMVEKVEMVASARGI